MLPNVKDLHIASSVFDSWPWAAFPNACYPDVPRRLPQGLRSLISLDVHYGPEYPYDGHFGHIKLAAMLLLPKLRRLSFNRVPVYEGEWWLHHVVGWNGYLLDLAPLKDRSSVTQLELRGVNISPDLLRHILGMLRAPESVHIERYGEPDFTMFDPVLAQQTLRSFTLVEYPGDYPDPEGGWKPLLALSKCDHLTHIALPVHALTLDKEDDLARKIPRGVEHLDLAYAPEADLLGDIDRLVKLAHSLAEPGRRVRRLTVRPALRDANSDCIRAACAASSIVFCEQPLIEDPSYDTTPASGRAPTTVVTSRPTTSIPTTMITVTGYEDDDYEDVDEDDEGMVEDAMDHL